MLLLLLIGTVVAGAITVRFYAIRDPLIRHLPVVPTKWPVFGNLLQIGKAPCLTYWALSKKYGPVFQVLFGVKRIVVVNSYESAKFLWVDSMAANCSRPQSYTFHKVVSTSQGLTVGTTPWSASHKRKRRATSSALNKPSIKSYMSIIDFESAVCIKRIFDDLHQPDVSLAGSIDIRPYFNTFSLNTSLTLGYGTRLNDLDKQTLAEIMAVESAVGRFRGTFSSNYQDYLPFLRWFPSCLNSTTATAIDTRKRRDRYMDALLLNLRKEIEQGISRPCIIGNILRLRQNSMDGASSGDKLPSQSLQLSEAELKSICLTMVSAGLDTVPAILIFFLGHMSQDYGQEIQKKAWDEITRALPPGEVWGACLESDYTDFPYIQALMKEALRFSGMPLSLPRETIKDIQLNQEVVIPRGSTLLLNSFAANFDAEHFCDPYQFKPERYLKNSTHKQHSSLSGPAHFSFGAGLRMCCGSLLAEREIFTAIVRLISSFEVFPPDEVESLMPSDPFEIYKAQNSLMIDPPCFKVRLVPRDSDLLDKWISKSILVDRDGEHPVVGKTK